LVTFLINTEKEGCFFFYIDGHVRVYHGDKAKLTKKFVSRQKLCLQGTTEFWVNNQEGMPFMVFTGELNEKLKDIIKEKIVPELIGQTKSLIGQASLDADPQLPRFTIIFDREAYEPAFFKWLWDNYRIAVITYRKNVKEKWDENDFRKQLPRFTGEHLKNNQMLVKAFADMASDLNCTPAQLSLAWVLAQGSHIIPIPGTKHRKYLEENAGATDIELTSSDLDEIEALLKRFPNIGSRYTETFAKQLDKS